MEFDTKLLLPNYVYIVYEKIIDQVHIIGAYEDEYTANQEKQCSFNIRYMTKTILHKRIGRTIPIPLNPFIPSHNSPMHIKDPCVIHPKPFLDNDSIDVD